MLGAVSLRRLLLVFAIAGGCATTGPPPPPPDPHYQQGRQAFEGGRWLEAIANLRKVMVAACINELDGLLRPHRLDVDAERPRARQPGSGAHRRAPISSARERSDTEARPGHRGPPRTARRKRSESAWRGGDRSIAPSDFGDQSAFDNPINPSRSDTSSTWRPQVEIPKESLTETYLVDIPAPAGSHLLLRSGRSTRRTGPNSG